MRLALAAAAGVLAVAVAAPVYAGVAGGGKADLCPGETDCRPCVTKGEWDTVKDFETLTHVINTFDSSPDVSDIWDPFGPHPRHRRSVWKHPGQCSDGTTVTVYFRDFNDGPWLVESKCWNGDCTPPH